MSKKYLVKVLDGGCYYDYTRKEPVTVLPHRPYVVEESTFFQTAVSQKRLAILGEVRENCTDDQFQRAYANAQDKNKAVSKYLKEKSPSKEAEVEEQPKEEVASVAEAEKAPEGENK